MQEEFESKNIQKKKKKEKKKNKQMLTIAPGLGPKGSPCLELMFHRWRRQTVG